MFDRVIEFTEELLSEKVLWGIGFLKPGWFSMRLMENPPDLSVFDFDDEPYKKIIIISAHGTYDKVIELN